MTTTAEQTLLTDTGARIIGRTTLHGEVAARLRAMILEGELPPGAHIPEAQLCTEFGVSRTPLREALKVLASEGLVELLHSRGAIVKPISIREVADIFEVMAGLEVLNGRLVCERATDAQVDHLRGLHEQLGHHHRNGQRTEYFRLNQTIHGAIATVADNGVLLGLHADFSGKIRRARYIANMLQARWDESLEEHESFMTALLARDGELMGRRLGEHMHNTGVAVMRALREIAT